MYNQDIDYLKESGISKIISKGLAETYLMKPNMPIDYLANWLLKYVEIEKQKDVQKSVEARLTKEQEAVLMEDYANKLRIENSEQQAQALKQEKLKLLTALENVHSLERKH